MHKLEIWTDGSYRASVDIGGIGAVILQDGEIITKLNQQYTNTTNNQMEIRALIEALKCVTTQYDTITVYTDSQYCIGIINYNWKAVKNPDLWREFFHEHDRVKKLCRLLMFKYTKGHAEDVYNNMADKLATDASGHTTPKKDNTCRIFSPKSMIIALDFDGTVVKHRYPEIGESIGAEAVLQALQQNGYQFILNTMRSTQGGRNCLKEAADWFANRNINLIGINCNPWQSSWTNSPKPFAHLYIDDSALGIPLKKDSTGSLPYVDWEACLDLFAAKYMLSDDQATELRKTFL